MNHCNSSITDGWTDRTATVLYFALWLTLACISGCGNNGKSLAPVSGLITLDGKPLAEGSVVFQPIAPPGSTIAGKGSAAFCDAEGRYKLETIAGEPGAIVGDHRVRIYGPRKGAQVSSEIDGGGVAPLEVVPEKYNYATTLTFVVSSEGTAEANFDLTTK